jgi:hypothetical protein
MFTAPTALVKFKRYSYANMPFAGDPANPLKVRDCKRPVPPALIGTSADVSLTPMVQGDAVVKTQLIAGAPTFTTFKGAAPTAGARAKSKPINRFRMKTPQRNALGHLYARIPGLSTRFISRKTKKPELVSAGLSLDNSRVS